MERTPLQNHSLDAVAVESGKVGRRRRSRFLSFEPPPKGGSSGFRHSCLWGFYLSLELWLKKSRSGGALVGAETGGKRPSPMAEQLHEVCRYHETVAGGEGSVCGDLSSLSRSA